MRDGRYMAYYMYNGKLFNVVFDTLEEAVAYRRTMFEQIYGEFARHE